MRPGDPHDDDIAEPEMGFEREASLLRSLGAGDLELVDAPDSVWTGIEAAVAEEAPDRGAARHPLAPPADRPIVEHEAPVVSMEDRRRRRPRWLVAAAAAVVIGVVAGIGVLAWGPSDDGPDQVASTQLAALPGVDVGAANATVRLERDGDDLSLQVDMDDLPAPAPGTFYELWLLDGGDGTPVSVAEMRDPASHVSTTVPVPANTDTDRFDVVDVSVQHDGAGPAHSGESILRGTLTA